MVVADPELMERLALWARDERLLLFAHFGLTRHCNLRCRFCFWGDEVGRRGFMPREVFQKALEEMSQMGTFEIELTGGEPTIHPEFPEFVEIASRLRFVITVTTNGFRLSEKALAAISDGLVAEVGVSVHGARAETHDRLVGRAGAWESATRNIRRLIGEGVRVSVGFVVNKENYREIEDARAMFKDMGAGFQLAVKVYNPFRLERVEGLRLRGEGLRDVVRIFPDPPVCVHPCGAFTNTLYLAYNGDVWPCITLPIRLGNISGNSLEEIWEGLDEKSGSLRRELVSERKNAIYRGVDYFCPSISRACDGSLGGLDPYLKEIIDLWLAERESLRLPAKTESPSPPVPSSQGQEIQISLETQGFYPAHDVAFRLLAGREKSFLLFWKKAGNRYIALEGPWAEAVCSLLEGGTVGSSIGIMESSFEGFDRDEALDDMRNLIAEIVRMGFINPPNQST
jgi:MoaA/NifB/PqqE/SkfB family radical SAM enzyme